MATGLEGNMMDYHLDMSSKFMCKQEGVEVPT